MRKKTSFTQSYNQLPQTLPIFPLGGAAILPGGTLALNIFEPRYLNMIQDAMKHDQLIGMIQPKDELSPSSLHKVGCAARIIRYSETNDGRLEILLQGLCRFSLHEELSSMRGYRLVKPNWAEFKPDFSIHNLASDQSFELFSNALRRYFNEKNVDVDWEALDRLSQSTLVNNLIGQLALSHEDKQLLIEADTLSDRVKSFTAILNATGENLARRH
jgi:Lon protease-like protein